MKTTMRVLMLVAAGIVFAAASCEKKNVIDVPDTQLVSQFVYDGLSLYYLWSDEVVSKKPSSADTDPETYFYNILNSTDKKKQWSYITDDVNTLLAGLSGEELQAFGFDAAPFWADETRTQVIAFVRLVFPDTPAERAGIRRGDVITHANGSVLNGDNYRVLFGSNATTTFTVYDQHLQNQRQVQITPANFGTDPVLFSKVYEIGGKKIGYLFYTNFYSNYNASLYGAFSAFKAAGVSDVVLDLRYNTGGSVQAATYLASLIAPEAAVRNKEVFGMLSFNDFVNNEYDRNKQGRNYVLGNFSKADEPDPLGANPGLDKVYVIATGGSYSASEMLAFCLKPFIGVEHIGEKTGGKYTVSWTVHPYSSLNNVAQQVYVESRLNESQKNILKNWAMQPIVGRYTDSHGNDFSATDGLIPNHPVNTQEQNPATWKPIGDVDDYLFAKAISLITGTPYTQGKMRSGDLKQYTPTGFLSPKEMIMKEAVVIDMPHPVPQND